MNISQIRKNRIKISVFCFYIYLVDSSCLSRAHEYFPFFRFFLSYELLMKRICRVLFGLLLLFSVIILFLSFCISVIRFSFYSLYLMNCYMDFRFHLKIYVRDVCIARTFPAHNKQISNYY